MRLSPLVSIAMLVANLAACSDTLDRVHEERGTAQVNRKLELEGSPFSFRAHGPDSIKAMASRKNTL